MKKGTVWLLLSVLIAVTLVLSCGPAVEEEEAEEEEEVAEEEEIAGEEEEEEEEEVTSDEPRYGGVVRIIREADTRTFDDCYIWSSTSYSWSVNITNDELIEGDWSRGPAGTNEVSYLLYSGFDGQENFATGSGWAGLAESWELDADGTYTFHLRQGVHFHDKAPANGRELTAEDVVYNINRQWYETPSFLSTTHRNNAPTPSAPDKYTVVVKFAALSNAAAVVNALCDLVHIYPPEAIEEFGDMKDWRNSIGTGAFMITDYVQGSSATFVRNPNSWQKYPVKGPGYGKQIPFVDGVKILVIPDRSTQSAAMRTGKADQGLFGWEDRASLKKTNPELMDTYYYYCDGFIHMKMDNPDLPWYDRSVRQALRMAVDYQAIVDDYYGGEALFFTRVIPMVEYKDLDVPFEELPESVQELYNYNPEKAKQMLADAGYGDGFEAELICQTKDVDLLSIYKDYLSKIGVNLILDVKEPAVYASMRAEKSLTEMMFGGASTALSFNLGIFLKNNRSNLGLINDPRVEQLYVDIWAAYRDWDKRTQLFRESTPWMLEEAWHIPTPAYKQYSIWQPWLKGYHGEYGTGNSDFNTFAKWIWIDQDLKEAMTGTR